MSAKELWLGLSEIGKALGVTDEGAAKMIKRGELPAAKIGRRWCTSPAMIEGGLMARLRERATAREGEEGGENERGV